MLRRQRRLIIFLVLLVAIGLTILFVWLFAIRDTSLMRVVRLSDLSQNQTRDYRQSSLQLHPGGAFNIELVITRGPDDNSIDTVLFAAHGTWERHGNKIHLTFTDAWGLVSDTFTQNPDQKFIGETLAFYRHRRGLRFIDHRQQVFYFS